MVPAPAQRPQLEPAPFSFVNGRFRVYFHNGLHGFSVAEAAQAGGPYALLTEHRLSDMHEQWAPSVFEDDDGALYLVASNSIQALDADGLGFRGPRAVVTTGFLENPWLIKRAGWYYWFCSENGTDVSTARQVESIGVARAAGAGAV